MAFLFLTTTARATSPPTPANKTANGRYITTQIIPSILRREITTQPKITGIKGRKKARVLVICGSLRDRMVSHPIPKGPKNIKPIDMTPKRFW